MRFVGIGLCLDERLRDFFFFEKAGSFFFNRSVGIGFTCSSHINIGLIYVHESHM